jgi:hypothetical protein
VQTVRENVENIQQHVKDAEPYTDAATVERQLRGLGEKLNSAWPEQGDPFPWYGQLVDGFKNKAKPEALQALDELQSRLALLEETLTQPEETNTTQPPRSKNDIKKLLRQRNDTPATSEPKKTKKNDPQDEPEPKRVVIRRDGASPSPDVPTVAAPAEAGYVCLYVFAGLVLAVVVAALVLFLVNRPWGKRTPAAQTGQSAAVTEQTVEQLHEQPVAELLRRADALAEQGQFLEALRAAFLASLSLLHRKQMLRYEATRTNGEYVREVRLAPHAPASLHEPFDRLTAFFEVKWYGERGCDGRDYRTARELVETIQGIVGAK